jgi:hypothetical protein
MSKESSAGKGLGIAGFVLGLIALIISFIPCLGMYALAPGIVAIILSAIALIQASKSDAEKGLIIAALVISIIGTSIAAYQYSILSSAANSFIEMSEEFNSMTEEEQEAVTEEIIENLEDLDETESFDEVINTVDDAFEELNENAEGIDTTKEIVE